MYLIWGCACERQHSRQTHKAAQHAPHPHNQALPSPTTAQDPRFQPPAGCQRAHNGQHGQLAASSHSWRARRPGATRRPGAEAFAHSTTTPLHFNHPALGPGSLPARPCPEARREAAPKPPGTPFLPGKRRRNPQSRENQRGATPRTHTGWKQRPVPVTTIPTPCTRSRAVSTKRETVPGA